MQFVFGDVSELVRDWAGREVVDYEGGGDESEAEYDEDDDGEALGHVHAALGLGGEVTVGGVPVHDAEGLARLRHHITGDVVPVDKDNILFYKEQY